MTTPTKFIARSYAPSIHDRVPIRSSWPANPTVPPGWGTKKEKREKKKPARPRVSIADALRALGA